jgi:hypothetical protein
MDAGPNDDAPAPLRLVRPYLGQSWVDERPNEEIDEHDAPPGSVLRPFLLTAGRVAETAEFAVETQVVSTADRFGRHALLRFEHSEIVALCTVPLSIAEVAARLRLHIGVVRVLVSDLRASGDLAVYQPPNNASRDIDTLLRVIRGLRAIS